MKPAKILLATQRGPPEDSREFFGRAVQPFLEENVLKGRRKGLVVCEAMLYRMHFDFRSATEVRTVMGRASEGKLGMLQLGLDATARMMNSQFEATISKGKRPLPPLRLGFEDFVMRLNRFNRGAITVVVEPQDARASFMHAEAESLVEGMGYIHGMRGRTECLNSVIAILAEAAVIRNRLICGMIESALDLDPALAIVLPRGPGNAGLHRSLDSRRCDIRLASDGSFMTYLEQAVVALMGGEIGPGGLEEYSRLHLRYLEYLDGNSGRGDWKKLSLEAALYAVSDGDEP